MAIHFISGKPRAGKSLYAVRLVVEELVYGTRPVVTNLSFDRGRLSEYLQEKHPDKIIDLHSRLVLLDDDETKSFWCHRPGCTSIKPVSKEEWKRGVRPDYSGVTDKGVFFAIDEIHNFFNARAWQECGLDVLFYISQHGKVGDTILCITQAIGNVDSQFRSVTQDFTYIRNLSKEKLGLFKLPNLFMRRTFVSPPTETSTPCETGTFRLDVTGLASCYHTATGVGIHGRLADKEEKRNGLPWWSGFAAIGLVALLLFMFVPRAVASLFAWHKPKTVAVSKPVEQQKPAAQEPPLYRTPASNIVDEPQHKWRITGIAKLPDGRTFVTLSDGRVAWVDAKGHISINAF